METISYVQISGREILFPGIFGRMIHAGIIIFILTAAFPNQLQASSPENCFSEETVRIPRGNMYIRPAESASVVDTLKQGDRITVIGREGEWYMAKLPDQRLGWVHENLFREIPEKDAAVSEPPYSRPAPEQKVAGDARVPEENPVLLFQVEVKVPSARIRKTPSFSSDVSFGLEKGEKVTVMSRENNWYHVRTENSRTGWGFHSLFRIPDEFSELSSEKTGGVKKPEVPFQAVTKIEMARIRENPSFESEVAFRLKKGKTVTVNEVKDDWFRIENEEGKTGWAHHLHFSRLPSPGNAPDPVISSIRFETDSDKSEKIIIALNGFHPPDETFALDEEIPKLVCDFYEVSLTKGIDKVISVNGKMIRTIRVGIHKGSRPKVRVVVDLDPQKKYNVEQVFFKKTNLYTLTFNPIAE